MATQFLRSYVLNVAGIEISNLDITFTIKRSLKPKVPNTAEINVYNLSREQISAVVSHTGDVPVNLSAGYQGENSLIFAGSLRLATMERQGPDLILKVSSGDGEKKARKARVAKTFPPRTTILTVVKACAAAMGVGLGNVETAITKAEFPKGGATFPCGTVLAGDAAEELRLLLRSIGMEYSIQNGSLQVLTRGQALGAITTNSGKTAGGLALLLNETTGVLGTPSVGSDGVARANVTMLPDLFPGRLLKFDMPDVVTGNFRASTLEFKGNLRGDEWGAEIEAEPLFPVGQSNVPVNT